MELKSRKWAVIIIVLLVLLLTACTPYGFQIHDGYQEREGDGRYVERHQEVIWKG